MGFFKKLFASVPAIFVIKVQEKMKEKTKTGVSGCAYCVGYDITLRNYPSWQKKEAHQDFTGSKKNLTRISRIYTENKQKFV